MEIEVELGENQKGWLWGGLLVLLLAAFFVFVGRTFTAMLSEPRVYTWQDWYVYKYRKQVRSEWKALRQDYLRLYESLEVGDPIRVAVVAEGVMKTWEEDGLSTLSPQREALLTAARMALAWSQGKAERGEVQAALKKAKERLDAFDAASGNSTP